MRELGLAGAIAIAFTLVSYYATRGPAGGELGWYGWVNLVGGGAALLVAAGMAVRRARGFGTPAARRILLPHLAATALLVTGFVVAEGAARKAGWRFDWTADARFELAPATLELCARLEQPARATHFAEPGDPDSRRTRFLLESFVAAGCFDVREKNAEQSEAELDLFGVSTPDAVVLEVGEYYDVVERASEGSLLETLLRLESDPTRTLYVTIGEGEGDFRAPGPAGYSGLREALGSEGYVLKSLVLVAAGEVPEDADGVLVIAPRRPLHASAQDALERYVSRGGRLVTMLEPGIDTGLEPLLERFGIDAGPGLVVDSRFADLQGTARGTGVLVSDYADHPVVEGFEGRHMSFFPSVRAVVPARKPTPDDQLAAILYTSREAFLFDNVEAARRGIAPTRGDARLERFPLAASGRYPRETGEGRIVAFGDADFASNRYARALYNLDVVLNAVHWALEREPQITRRPKVLTPYQTPLPPQTTLQMLYGVGLLVPEVLLIIGGIVWIRRRSG